MRHLYLVCFLLPFLSHDQIISVTPERSLKDKRGFDIKLDWIKGKDVIIGNDSFCVAFFDIDVNGCFTSRKDKIALIPYGTDSANVNSYCGTKNIKQNLILGFNGKAYEITIDTNGCNPITIQSRPDILPPIQLKVGDPLPHFDFRIMNGDSIDIYSLLQPGKPTYIEFWGTWCTGCVQSVEKLKTLQQTKSDSLVIISLDSYDEREDAKKFVKEKEMNWMQGFSNTAIEKLLYVGDEFPYGILIDGNGKIIAFDVSPYRLSRIIK